MKCYKKKKTNSILKDLAQNTEFELNNDIPEGFDDFVIKLKTLLSRVISWKPV